MTSFYNWPKILFERAVQLFDRKPNAANVRRQEAAAEKTVTALEAKLVQKNEVIHPRSDRRRQEKSSTPRKASRQPPDPGVSSSVSQEDRALLGSNPSV